MEAKQSHFIELRAAGQSYNKISKQLEISKNTLLKWSKEFSNDISNAKALEIESIREEYLLSRQHRLRILGTQLNQISQEILKRDLNEVPTWRLFEMQRKVINEIDKDPAQIEFILDTPKSPSDSVKDLFTKTERWTG